MENTIIDIFYEEVVPNLIKGRTEICGVGYHVHCNVMIANIPIGNIDSTLPTLMINNTEQFNEHLVRYIEKHVEYLNDDIFTKTPVPIYVNNSYEQIKYLLTILFVNARSNDFNNPVEYLKTRTLFLENDILREKFPSYTSILDIEEINSYIEVASFKQLPSNETPYAFFSRIVSDDDIYDLPKIRYGIKEVNCEKEVYIYAIQGNRKKKVLTSFEKKINRYLFKIDKGVVKDEEYLRYKKDIEMGIDSDYPENIIDVTHKSVVALTVFLRVIKELGIKKVTVVDYLPARYLEKYDATKASNNLFKGIYSPESLDKKFQKDIMKINDDQFNITNKFIRTFNRVNYHLKNMDNLVYPYEIDDSMHFMINDNEIDDDNLVNKIYNGITINNIKKK